MASNKIHIETDPEDQQPKTFHEMSLQLADLKKSLHSKKDREIGACCGCCTALLGIILALGSMAMTGLGIYYIADNAAAAAGANPLIGWIPLDRMTSPGFITDTTKFTGLCTYATGYNATCTYPATCEGVPQAYNDCVCDIPKNEYAYSYYKEHSYPPKIHCGEIKSNDENIRKRNMGIILLVSPYGFAIIAALIMICMSCCFAAAS